MRRGSCIHYRGAMSKPACVAGVPEGTFDGWGPCWNANAPKGGQTCEASPVMPPPCRVGAAPSGRYAASAASRLPFSTACSIVPTM